MVKAAQSWSFSKMKPSVGGSDSAGSLPPFLGSVALLGRLLARTVCVWVGGAAFEAAQG